MLFDRDGSGRDATTNHLFRRLIGIQIYSLSGQISEDEMVDMFLMMVQEEEGEMRNMVFMDEVVRKADEMSKCLDIDGDGEVTEVN